MLEEKDESMDVTTNKTIIIQLRSTIKLLWILRLDFIISYMMFASILYYNGRTLKTKKKIILAIDQQSFRENILALHDHKSKYNFIVFPEIMRTILGETCWPMEIRKETGFYEKKERYRNALDRLEKIHYNALLVMTKITTNKIKAVVAEDFDNYQDYPWIAAIHKMKGKFIAYCNENVITKQTKEETTKKFVRHIFRFDGDAILFHNNEAKTLFERLISFEKNKIHVTGEPRMDNLVQMKRKKGTFIAVVTFAKYGKLWKETTEALHSNKQLKKKIVMICKDDEGVEYAIKRHEPEEIYISMDVVLEEGPKAVIGVNSKDCIDALIAGVPVIMPFWAEAKKTEDDETELLGNHTRKFHDIAKTKEALLKLIDSYMNDTKEHPLKQEAREYIERRYSLIDGNNCKRFFDVVDKISR
jgi:hypothetical protein